MTLNEEIKAINIRVINEFLIWLNECDHVSDAQKGRVTAEKLKELKTWM